MRRAARRSSVMMLGLLLVAVVEAAEWGTIQPGKSTMDTVRARYGAATRTTTEKTEGYDTAQWVYEGNRAPAGIQRLVVDFGFLERGTFRPQVVRSFRLEPKPGVFTRATIVAGWGEPDRESPVDQLPRALFYDAGLLVYFDKAGWQVESMLFVVPQTPKDGPGAPKP